MAETAEARHEVKAVLEVFFRALDTRDMARIEQVVAHDPEMVHIGTARDEIWRGWDSLREATREQFAGLEAYEATIRELTVHLSPGGEVAWYAHLLDARIRSRGREHVWRGARFTGVLERREGRWVMVQTHVSLPEAE